MNKTLVIIVTYNAMKWADKCFGSLLVSEEPVDVFVVDNGSTDGTISYIRQNYPDFYLVASAENLGFGEANNVGFKYALDHSYEYVYLLNQDAWIFSDTIKNLISVFNQNEALGILSPFQLNSDGRRMEGSFRRIVSRIPDLLDDMYNGQLKPYYKVEYVMAAHWMLRVDAIRQIGLFSPSFPHYGEDDNYCSRMMYHNKQIGIAPSSIAVHDRDGRPFPLSKTIYLRHIHNIMLISNPYYTLSKSLKLCIKSTLLAGYRKGFFIKSLGLCFKICPLLTKLVKNRDITKEKGAFVD